MAFLQNKKKKRKKNEERNEILLYNIVNWDSFSFNSFRLRKKTLIFINQNNSYNGIFSNDFYLNTIYWFQKCSNIRHMIYHKVFFFFFFNQIENNESPHSFVSYLTVWSSEFERNRNGFRISRDFFIPYFKRCGLILALFVTFV